MLKKGYDPACCVKVFHDENDDKMYLVDGRHRFHAAKLLGMKKIPSIVLRDPQRRTAIALKEALVLCAHGARSSLLFFAFFAFFIP
jgi:hypothetical protein